MGGLCRGGGMITDAAAAALGAIASRTPQVFVYVAGVRRVPGVDLGLKLRFETDDRLIGSLGSEALDGAVARDAADALRTGEPITHTYAADGSPASRRAAAYVKVFFDPIVPTPRLVIAGAGHIAQPLALCADLLEFETWVVDDRADYANRERFPTADRVVVDPMHEFFSELRVDPATYVVLVTRAHRYDEESLRQLLDTPAPYIGMIGSRRRVHIVHQTLLAEGISPDKFRRVYAPIGLDIGSRTPAEIALAIMAEIVNLRRGGRASHLSLELFRAEGDPA
ncbi:MAG: XdhC family protein [Chloroflexi bacterium]|nr:XdhC family protein [Chloroflexota bacterium]